MHSKNMLSRDKSIINSIKFKNAILWRGQMRYWDKGNSSAGPNPVHQQCDVPINGNHLNLQVFVSMFSYNVVVIPQELSGIDFTTESALYDETQIKFCVSIHSREGSNDLHYFLWKKVTTQCSKLIANCLLQKAFTLYRGKKWIRYRAWIPNKSKTGEWLTLRFFFFGRSMRF